MTTARLCEHVWIVWDEIRLGLCGDGVDLMFAHCDLSSTEVSQLVYNVVKAHSLTAQADMNSTPSQGKTWGP
jgi:hypothetical protein